MFDRDGRSKSTASREGDDSKEKPIVSRAGPTPFHRRQSYIPKDSKIEKWTSFKWQIYDNNGSYNGWFDWLPLWMRVGYWSPFFVISLAFFYTAIFWFRPRPLELSPTAIAKLDEENENYLMGMPKTTSMDLLVFIWGMAVVIHARITMTSIGGFFISFTGWSWGLITSRAGLEFGAWMAAIHNKHNLAMKLATWGSSIRLVTITNACVVCTIWNLILLPIIYFVSMPAGEKRRNFLKFNFGFFMTNIHILNFPLAAVNTISGSRLRLFTMSDLWVSYAVVMLYSILYLFVMDRLGLHFYPIFCPRSAFCVVSFVAVIGLYYFLFLKWNEFIEASNYQYPNH